MKARTVLIVGVALTIVALSWSSAQAGGGVRIGIGLPIGIGVGVGPAYPPPYYYRPYPYYYPPAYYYAPYPYGYAAPAPVYVQPAARLRSTGASTSAILLSAVVGIPGCCARSSTACPSARAYRHRHRFRKPWPSPETIFTPQAQPSGTSR